MSVKLTLSLHKDVASILGTLVEGIMVCDSETKHLQLYSLKLISRWDGRRIERVSSLVLSNACPDFADLRIHKPAEDFLS